MKWEDKGREDGDETNPEECEQTLEAEYVVMADKEKDKHEQKQHDGEIVQKHRGNRSTQRKRSRPNSIKTFK